MIFNYKKVCMMFFSFFLSTCIFANANTQQEFDDKLNELVTKALISFEKGKYEVNKNNAGVVNELAKMLKSSFFAEKTLSIHGYADTTGNGRGFDNQKLSEKRARIVYNYLLKTMKVPSGRISDVVGWVIASKIDSTRTEQTHRSVRFYIDHKGQAYKFDNLIPKKYQIDMQKNGLALNKGNNPPNIEGEYFISPHLLQFTSDNNFTAGTKFADMRISFKYEVNEINEIVITYDSESGRTIKTSNEVRVMGSGNNFTAYFIADCERNGVYSKTANIISGEKTKDGIKNINIAFLMLEKGTDEPQTLMNIGQYRIFKSGEDLSKSKEPDTIN